MSPNARLIRTIEMDVTALIDETTRFSPEEVGCAWLIVLGFYKHGRGFDDIDAHSRARRMLLGKGDVFWARHRDAIEQCSLILLRLMAEGETFRRRHLPATVRQAVYVRDGGVCRYCAARVTLTDFHCDHIVPVTRGGGDDLENLACACVTCNLAKGPRLPDEWRLEQ